MIDRIHIVRRISSGLLALALSGCGSRGGGESTGNPGRVADRPNVHVIDIKTPYSDVDLLPHLGTQVRIRGEAGFLWASNCAFVRGVDRVYYLNGFHEDWPDGISKETEVVACGELQKRKILRDPVLDRNGRPRSNGAFGDQYVLLHPRWTTTDRTVALQPKQYVFDLKYEEEELEPMIGHLVAIEGQIHPEVDGTPAMTVGRGDLSVRLFYVKEWQPERRGNFVRAIGSLDEDNSQRRSGVSRFGLSNCQYTTFATEEEMVSDRGEAGDR